MPPTVCINRPNRTKTRHFTEKDLDRIAKTMEKQGHAVRNIIAVILISMGFGVLICKLSGAIERSLGILAILKQMLFAIATAGAVNAIIIWLSRVRAVPIPIVTTIIGWLLVFFLAVRALAKGAAGLASDLETIEDMFQVLNEWCLAVRERLPGA